MLGLTPWMIRTWSAQGYGEFAIGSSTFVLLSLTDVGIRANTRLALCRAGEKHCVKWPGILANSAIAFAVVGAVTVCLAIVLTVAGVGQTVFKISTANRNLLFATTTMTILVMLSGLLLEPLVAIGQIGKLKLATASGWLAAIPATSFVLFTKGSVTNGLMCWLACLLGANLIVLFRHRAVFRGMRVPRVQLEFDKLVATFKESFWFNICNASWTLKTYGTTLVISALIGPAAAGFFFILLRLSEVISALGAISSDVSFGELAHARTAVERRRSFHSSYSWAVVLCSHIALVIGFCTRDLLQRWLHPATPMSIFVGGIVVALGLASAFNRTVTYAAMGLDLARNAAQWGLIEAGVFAAAIVASCQLGLMTQLSLATLSAFALIPLALAVSHRLGISFAGAWLQSFRFVAPFLAASALVLFAGRRVAEPWGNLAAVTISGLIALTNVFDSRRRLRPIQRSVPADQGFEAATTLRTQARGEALTI